VVFQNLLILSQFHVAHFQIKLRYFLEKPNLPENTLSSEYDDVDGDGDENPRLFLSRADMGLNTVMPFPGRTGSVLVNSRKGKVKGLVREDFFTG